MYRSILTGIATSLFTLLGIWLIQNPQGLSSGTLSLSGSAAITIFLLLTFLPEIVGKWRANGEFLWRKGREAWTRLTTPATESSHGVSGSTLVLVLIVGVILGAASGKLIDRIPWPVFPPTPTPTPTPPEPTPTPVPPAPDPIPGDEFRVLILEETGDRQNYTPAQLSILDGTEWRAKVVSKGGRFRVLDTNLTEHPSFQKDEPWVQSAVATLKAIPKDRTYPLPILVISKGSTGEIITISPTTTLTQFQDLITKYADK